MQIKDKVALFDFCETLVDFQTADAYVNYVREKSQNKRMQKIERTQSFLVNTRVMMLLEKLTFGRFAINKRLKLSQLKGFNYEELDNYARDYYYEKIQPHLITPILEELKSLKNQGFKVGIVSGGYGIYEKLFVKDYGLDFLLCSNIQIGSNGICTGKMEGKDCMNENKIEYLERYFDNTPQYTVSYSDSISDLPFLRWANDGVVVSRGKHQIWVDKYNFKEIVWKI